MRLTAILPAAALGLICVSSAACAQQAPPGGDSPARPLWTTSRITGSPEPPPPFRVERAFPRLKFEAPVELTGAPGSDRLFVAEQSGKIYSFPDDRGCESPDLAIDLARHVRGLPGETPEVRGLGAVYGMAFHPKFPENRHVYICYVMNPKRGGEVLPLGTRVSRFRMLDASPPRIDPASETVLIRWRAGGHNGGCLRFGPDGFLYISTGDSADPTPPDPLDTGQDISDLLSSILRIDVDRADPGRPYAIPPDNPFRDLPGARGEVWAFGFRNPWKFSFDRETGDLWVGDVGWEMWELVDRVVRGGNYGWSVMEGRQPVRPEARRGPTPILPPTIDIPHSEGASVTGGYVYRGKKFPELVGSYIYADWVSRRFWATRHDGRTVTSHRVLSPGNAQVIAFAEDKDGELYTIGYEDGLIRELVRNDAAAGGARFPRTLGETGLFASVKDHAPAPGVFPFAINAEPWADHATAERLVAVPGRAAIDLEPAPASISGGPPHFPKDGVLARTFSIETVRGRPETRKRLETQLLHFDGRDWQGYSYAWNDEGTDAHLVGAEGANRTIVVTDPEAPGGRREQTWHFPSRAECLTCHNLWTGFRLSFIAPQLDRDRDGTNQLEEFLRMGILSEAPTEAGSRRRQRPKEPVVAWSDPYDTSEGLDTRARSYLQVNCAHCHQFGAGGTTEMHVRFDAPLPQTKLVDARPTQGTFGIYDARIVAPGDPYRSVLLYRMAKLGPGRMPRIGSELLDERGLRLMRDWIAGLSDEEKPGTRPSADPLANASGSGRGEAIARMLGSTSGALRLARCLADGAWSGPAREEVLAAAVARPEAEVRDLFEAYVPASRKVRRLGTSVRPAEILARRGDAGRGRELFFNAAGLPCKDCHQVEGKGNPLGPDLSQVGKKLDRAGLLESLLEPSKLIEPKYLPYIVETADGLVHTGLLAEKSEAAVTLRTAQNKEVRIPADQVERLAPQPQSLMPELLLRDLTPDQAADLLEFLGSLR